MVAVNDALGLELDCVSGSSLFRSRQDKAVAGQRDSFRESLLAGPGDAPSIDSGPSGRSAGSPDEESVSSLT